MTIQPQDQKFYEALSAYLAEACKEATDPRPIVPVKFNDDGSINRAGTLEFPCYAGIPRLTGQMVVLQDTD